MKKSHIILIAVFLIVLGVFSYSLKQQGSEIEVNCGDESADIQYFYSESCSVCARTSIFLDELQRAKPEIKIAKCSISEEKNIERLLEFYSKHNVPKDKYGAVPVIFTENKYFVGFNDSVASEIGEFTAVLEQATTTAAAVESAEHEQTIKIPIIGRINAETYSLPVLAAVLGFFDGFNICSLGALVLILGLVLALRNRKKILLFGGIFIFTTSLVYGVLILMWYNLFVFLAPYLRIMEVLVGVLGVAGGVYFLKDFIKFKKQGPTCELETGKGIMSKFSAEMQKKLEMKTGIIAIVLTILLFAVVITVAEFPCSAAVPLFFAGTLAAESMPTWQYLFYIALFILFYMLDEIIVFIIAVFTMTIKLASKKFIVWLTLIEAIVLFLLGFYYLFGFLIFH